MKLLVNYVQLFFQTMAEKLEIETFNRIAIEKFQKKLLPKKISHSRGNVDQVGFIRSAGENHEDFCKHLKTIEINKGSTPPVTKLRFTEQEFLDPPWSTELEIARTWGEISANLAARPETWTRINLELLKNGLIKSSFLAANGKSISGRSRIAQTISDNNPNDIDKCVRTIFRHLGGIIAERGYRTAFLDCPIAKAWWRHRYAKEANLAFPEFEIKELSNSLRLTFCWEELIQSMVSRLTIIGDSSIRPAVVRCFACKMVNSKSDVNKLFKWIGKRSTVQALGALDAQDVFKIIYEYLSNQQG